MSAEHRRRRPRFVRLGWLLGLGAISGCAIYHPAPLPELGEAARPPRLENESSVQAALAALGNPLFGHLTLDFEDGVDPREIGALAALLNPALRAARSERLDAQADLLLARLLPNPETSFEASEPFGTGSSGKRTAYQAVISLGTRSLLTRGSRSDAARAHAENVDLRIAWQEWQTARSAQLQALRLGWLQRRIAIASEELDLQETTTAALERASKRGDITVDQVGVQLASLESVRNALATLEQSAAASRSELSALVGGVDLPPLALPTGEERTGETSPPIQTLLPLCLARRVDLAALRAAYRSQEARLRQAVLEQIPDLGIGVTPSRDEASLKFLGGVVSLSAPIFDRNQANIAKQSATRARLAAEYRARVLEIRAELQRLLELIATIERRLPELEASIGPLERVERAERDAVRQGDLDRLSYQTVRLALLNQRLVVASLSQASQEAWVGLETACGGAFNGASTIRGGRLL